MKISLDALTGPNTAFTLGRAVGQSERNDGVVAERPDFRRSENTHQGDIMDRMYWGPIDWGEPARETAQERHDRETTEMASRLDEAIQVLIESAGEGQEITAARRQLKEVIAESTALQVEHALDWNR